MKIMGIASNLGILNYIAEYSEGVAMVTLT